MRYEIVKNGSTPELVEKECLLEETLIHLEELEKTKEYYGISVNAKDVMSEIKNGYEIGHAYFCGGCGTEVCISFQEPPVYSSLKHRLSGWKSNHDRLNPPEREVSPKIREINELRREQLDYLATLAKDLHELRTETAEKFSKECENEEVCPICGNVLKKEDGFFAGFTLHSPWNPTKDSNHDKELEKMIPLRESADRHKGNSEAKTYVQNCALSVTPPSSFNASKIKANDGEFKKYLLHLINLENNIYSLEKQLSELYFRRVLNNRAVILGMHKPAYTIRAKLEELRTVYQNALEEIGEAEMYEPDIDIVYPSEPVTPVLGKPNLFNKKRVLEENAALTAKYQAAMNEYQKEVRRCDEEKALLIAEARTAAITDAQQKAIAAKAALSEAEISLDSKIKALEETPIPAKAIKEVLDKEIAEAEELLKKTITTRNELYAYEIIFGKYRNVVALSSFYEYFMSGRCSALEGPDGAYNIYESEVRADRVIAQLDTVISSLEDIKQNQYMMYEQLCKIQDSLYSLNHTMDKALTSIQGIEANTASMNEYMEHISKNSDVIAHNTAVTAYYSKVNAELTNALGYMVAFK